MEILGALLAGVAIGSVLGFVGAGGAMLSVPILVYGFNYAPHQASVAALAVISAGLDRAPAFAERPRLRRHVHEQLNKRRSELRRCERGGAFRECERVSGRALHQRRGAADLT